MKKNIHLIITGGSDGIGKEIAKYYMDKISKVTILDKKNSKLKKSNFIKLDFTKNNQKKIKNSENLSFNKIIIINAAVKKTKKKIQFEKKRDLDDAFSISVSYPFMLFKDIINHAIKKKIYCKFINLGSILTKVISPNQSISYHLAKSGSLSLTKLFSVFFRSKYFTSVSINFGYLNKKYVNKSSKKILRMHQKLSNNSTPVNINDVIETINFIIKSDNNYLNGSEISVDHGISQIEQFYLS
jgi:3-oxoacyl-[acyl-carrier protein] reductase